MSFAENPLPWDQVQAQAESYWIQLEEVRYVQEAVRMALKMITKMEETFIILASDTVAYELASQSIDRLRLLNPAKYDQKIVFYSALAELDSQIGEGERVRLLSRMGENITRAHQANRQLNAEGLIEAALTELKRGECLSSGTETNLKDILLSSFKLETLPSLPPRKAAFEPDFRLAVRKAKNFLQGWLEHNGFRDFRQN